MNTILWLTFATSIVILLVSILTTNINLLATSELLFFTSLFLIIKRTTK